MKLNSVHCITFFRVCGPSEFIKIDVISRKWKKCHCTTFLFWVAFCPFPSPPTTPKHPQHPANCTLWSGTKRAPRFSSLASITCGQRLKGTFVQEKAPEYKKKLPLKWLSTLPSFTLRALALISRVSSWHNCAQFFPRSGWKSLWWGWDESGALSGADCIIYDNDILKPVTHLPTKKAFYALKIERGKLHI